MRGAAPSNMTIHTHSSVDTFWSQLDEETAPQQQIPRRRTTGSRTQVVRGGRTQQMEDGWADSSTYDPLWTETGPRGSRALVRDQNGYSGRLPTRRRGWRRFIYTLLILMCGVLVGAGGYLGWQWYQNRRTQAAELNKPLISSSIMNNLAAHTILIPGKDGETVYIS